MREIIISLIVLLASFAVSAESRINYRSIKKELSSITRPSDAIKFYESLSLKNNVNIFRDNKSEKKSVDVYIDLIKLIITQEINTKNFGDDIFSIDIWVFNKGDHGKCIDYSSHISCNLSPGNEDELLKSLIGIYQKIQSDY